MDSWCSKVRARNGAIVSGGAARNVRIAARGGMDQIIENVARRAAREALMDADETLAALRKHRPTVHHSSHVKDRSVAFHSTRH